MYLCSYLLMATRPTEGRKPAADLRGAVTFRWAIAGFIVFTARANALFSRPVAGVAQLVEHPPCKRGVAGSSPAAGTRFLQRWFMEFCRGPCPPWSGRR